MLSAQRFHRLILFSFPLFFILLADSIMSYLFPIVVESSMGSNTWMGIILALSSVCGILCDFIFPQLLRGKSWKFQLGAGILIAILFPIFLNLGAVWSSVYFFIAATLIWGIYFELLQFSQQSFVVSEQKKNEFSRDWGVLFLIWQMSAITGPLIASFLLTKTKLISTLTINSIQFVSLGLLFFIMIRLPHKTIKHQSRIQQSLQMIKEISIWNLLTHRIWPVMLSSILITFVMASFWTIGGLYGLSLFGDSGHDWFILVIFGIPMVLGSVLLSKLKIQTKKKKYVHIALFLAGISLASLFVTGGSLLLVLLAIFSCGFFLSIAAPLNEAVYSDLLERGGKSRMHLLGIAKSNFSLAYILAPLTTGWMADKLGYSTTFGFVGLVVLIISILLFLSTPRKLKLPQKKLFRVNSR